MIKHLFLLILASLFFGNSFCQELNHTDLEKISEYKEEIKKNKENNNLIQVADYYNKIAYLYWDNNSYQNAIDFFKSSLEININSNNKNAVKTIYYNIGLIYSDQENYNTALEYFNNGLKIARSLNQKEGIYSGLINSSAALKNLNKNFESNTLLNEALSIAQELNNLKLVRTCYGMIAENYEKMGDSESTMKYYDLFASIDRHIKTEHIKAIEEKTRQEVQKAEIEKNQTQQALSEKSNQLEKTQETLKKTEKITQQQSLELELKEAAIREKEIQLKNEKLVRYGITSIFLIILGFSILIFRQFKEKKKANKKLAEQNNQIITQKEEIEKQRDLATQQKKDITDSIEYAKRIQTALLPPANFIKRNLPEHFILFKPRDIVSGDFYWMMNKDDKIIIAAADCTGHGVPGAFMSMLGTAFLNEIVTKITENKHIYSLQANEILNQLRNYIIDSLHQSQSNESKDGIDMALCIIDSKNNKLQYSGAHNPLYIIKNNKLQVIKGDRMPVSIHANDQKSFTNHEIDIQENDIIYIFSDGFVDQIGGERDRKYMSRNFQEFLFKIHKEPMKIQNELLEKEFNTWKGDNIQLDDILIIGIKLEIAKKVIDKKESYDWSDKVILIAEDTDMNYIFLVEALKPTSVQLIRAKDGEEAIKICKDTEKIDLILMDINMPKLDGFESTKLIKEIKPQIPIIAQTALNIEDAREKSEEVGCDDFILKPIRLNQFLTKLASFLND